MARYHTTDIGFDHHQLTDHYITPDHHFACTDDDCTREYVHVHTHTELAAAFHAEFKRGLAAGRESIPRDL